MMSISLFLLVGLVIVIGYVILAYNGLIKHKNLVAEGWSGIDVQLRKRYNLIPNLINTVKGFAAHEKELFEQITALRTQGMDAKTVKEQSGAENAISKSLLNLFAVAENYPELKSNENFLNLQTQLSEIENDIQLSRRYYNGVARENNIAVESFPGNIIAGMFNFKTADFFEIDDAAERKNPEVKF